MIHRGHCERGAAGIYVTILISVVLFAFMAFAFDLGRLYLVQGEVQTAADAAALAAAMRLAGTYNSALHATDEAQTTSFSSASGHDNRFNLRTSSIGGNNNGLATILPPTFFATMADAQANTNSVDSSSSGAQARYVRVQISVQAPVIFSQLLGGSNRQVSVQAVSAVAVAGISAGVCTACGIDPLAVTAPDPTDVEDFGFALGGFYTLYLTTAQQFPSIPGCARRASGRLAGTSTTAEYTILTNHTPSGQVASDQPGTLFEFAAAGMSNAQGLPAPGCLSVGADETPAPLDTTTLTTCAVAAGVDALCGLNMRFAQSPPPACQQNITNATELASSYTQDTDLNNLDPTSLQDYSGEGGYDGNQRRVLTVPIVQVTTLSDGTRVLTILNFRQFLIQNDSNAANVPGVGLISTGAFRAQYIGHPAPVRGGTPGGTCLAFNPTYHSVGRPVLYWSSLQQ